ncbi:MAG: proline racemase family protein [Candidatus Promineifilaceae bacterium]|nr:proline racemase family protein [Candidatus Promineifilaceae bacterium]
MDVEPAALRSAVQRYGQALVTVDSHTAGEPTRLVVAGLPLLPGSTINERRLYMRQHLDHVRLLLTREPRGHRDMFAAVLTEPTSPAADFGLIYMDARRYPYMCGHATIGAVTTALELGWLEAEAGSAERRVVVDTPSVAVEALAELEADPSGSIRVKAVTLQMEAAFVQATGIPISVPNFGRVDVDLVCVGGYFAMVSADQVPFDLATAHTADLARLGMAIIGASNEQLEIEHPTRKYVNTVDVTEFYGQDADGLSRNAVVYGEAHVDRSPCGTGTAAKLALLHHHGQLEVGDSLENRGLLEAAFQGRIVAETQVGQHAAIVPEIRGSAHVTGVHHFVVGADDPFPKGFLF